MGRLIPIPEDVLNEMKPAPRILGGPKYENYARYLEGEMLDELAREKRQLLASMSWRFLILLLIKRLIS